VITWRYHSWAIPLLVTQLVISVTSQADVRFPPDSRIINVKDTPYFAKGDGTTDDTDAILRALSDWNAHTTEHSSRAVYLPAGTYLVSDTLQAIDVQGRTQSNIRLHGQGEGLTIIKLKKGAPGYSDPSKPKPVIATHGEDGNRGNWAYGNYVQHLTVDVGYGNAGAIGINYKVANWGAITHTTIVSPEQASGRFGLYIEDVSGAGFVNNLTVSGFNYGIYTKTSVNNIVLEQVQLNRQTIAGIGNVSKNLAIRGLYSDNRVPAIIQSGPEAYICLIDSELVGGSHGHAAIEHTAPSYLFARDVKTRGYETAIDNHPDAPAPDLDGGAESVIREWVSHPSTNLSPMSLNLPVRDAPEFHTNDFSKWANIETYGAIANDDSDDSFAVQLAIDSGAEVVYFPFGRYHIDEMIIVRKNVKKIDFIYSQVAGNGKIEIGDVSGDFIILENLDTGLGNGRRTLLHNSSKTLVIRHIAEAAWIIENTPKARLLFIEDMGPHGIVRLTDGIHAWIRQINREWVPFSNHGSTAWILGMNMEGKEGRSIPQFLTADGGSTEIIGGAIDPRVGTFEQEMGSLFDVINASFSVTIAGWASTGTYRTLVTEKRGCERRTLSDMDGFRIQKNRRIFNWTTRNSNTDDTSFDTCKSESTVPAGCE